MHYIAVAEKFELRRSSCAEVSQAVAAVDDDRFVFVEEQFSVVQQPREREMNRADYCSGTVLVRRQHVDDLATLGDDSQNVTMIDDPHNSNCTWHDRDEREERRSSTDRRSRNGTDYFRVTSWRMSTWGRPSSRAPIAPPKAFMWSVLP